MSIRYPPTNLKRAQLREFFELCAQVGCGERARSELSHHNQPARTTRKTREVMRVSVLSLDFKKLETIFVGGTRF